MGLSVVGNKPEQSPGTMRVLLPLRASLCCQAVDIAMECGFSRVFSDRHTVVGVSSCCRNMWHWQGSSLQRGHLCRRQECLCMYHCVLSCLAACHQCYSLLHLAESMHAYVAGWIQTPWLQQGRKWHLSARWQDWKRHISPSTLILNRRLVKVQVYIYIYIYIYNLRYWPTIRSCFAGGLG